MLKTKWLIYSVIIGLIPFFVRTIITLFSKSGTIDFWISEIDFISFGLMLNLANINELEDKIFSDKAWKTINVGCSIFFIIIFSSFFAIITYSDLRKDDDLNRQALKAGSVLLATVSLLTSYSIYNRLSKVQE